ncbi:EamA family transporter [Kyrpidia spormannii]|uniref:Uncharacterized protein n=1 Tax=Kyrpidia spormannii TaxID=2055160 RepID=A0ACA8ZCX8_9BACL|nr:EamA family transporter [Kyrpidia spormannii]CAB3395462.1 conserved membrane protein of unknown function [Kyrpidia spormannii]
MIYLLLLFNIVLLVAGQVCFKVGLGQVGGLHLNNVAETFFSPWILLGLLLYVAATVAWFAVLSRLSLSIAYPLQSLSYVLGVVAAAWIFHEAVPPVRWLGVLVILVGVALIAQS